MRPRSIGLSGIPKNDDDEREQVRLEKKRSKKLWDTFRQMMRRYDEHGDDARDYIVNALKNATKK
jgi:hypothetical protein